MLFEALKQFIRDKYYTYVECITMLNNYYAHAQLTHEQYDELMKMAEGLEINSQEDVMKMAFTQLKNAHEKTQTEIEKIKSALKNEGITIEEEKKADGTKESPIRAYRGAWYKSGLFYYDEEDGNVYECNYSMDDEDKEDIGYQMNYMPHELPNYFTKN